MYRLLGPAESRNMALAGILLLRIAAITAFWPRVLTVPLPLLCGWIAFALFVKVDVVRGR